MGVITRRVGGTKYVDYAKNISILQECGDRAHKCRAVTHPDLITGHRLVVRLVEDAPRRRGENEHAQLWSPLGSGDFHHDGELFLCAH